MAEHYSRYLIRQLVNHSSNRFSHQSTKLYGSDAYSSFRTSYALRIPHATIPKCRRQCYNDASLCLHLLCSFANTGFLLTVKQGLYYTPCDGAYGTGAHDVPGLLPCNMVYRFQRKDLGSVFNPVNNGRSKPWPKFFWRGETFSITWHWVKEVRIFLWLQGAAATNHDNTIFWFSTHLGRILLLWSIIIHFWREQYFACLCKFIS